MALPPDTHCPNCGRLLLSAAYSDKGGIGLIVHETQSGKMTLTVTDQKDLIVTCPWCGHQSPATTANILLATGWKG